MLVWSCTLLCFALPINACVYNQYLLFLIENYNIDCFNFTKLKVQHFCSQNQKPTIISNYYNKFIVIKSLSYQKLCFLQNKLTFHTLIASQRKQDSTSTPHPPKTNSPSAFLAASNVRVL